MKRSEMLSIIKQIVEEPEMCPVGFTLEGYILSIIEDAGMLPPFNRHWCYMDGDNANQESVSYCIWDNE